MASSSASSSSASSSSAASSSSGRPARLIEATMRQRVEATPTHARYTGHFASDWDIGSVPNGGYSLGTVVHCAQDFVQDVLGFTGSTGDSSSISLLHAGASYLVAVTSKADWHVEITLLKRGRNFVNLEGELKQRSRKTGSLAACQRVQLIFADFKAMHTPAAGLERFTPEPNSVYAPKPPLSATPPPPRSACEPWFKTSAWPVQGDDLESTRKVRQEQGKLFWAGYMYMPEEDERSVAAADIPRYNHAVINMLCDMAGNARDMLPPEVRLQSAKSQPFWFPTLFLTVELKRALPTDFPLTRVAATACTNEVRAGQWGYDLEIWSHPDDAQRLGLAAGVRSTRLAVSRQIATMVSMEVNKGFAGANSGSGAAKL